MYKISNKQILTFQEQLELDAGVKLQLKINDNRSTMLSVKWEPDFTKVSMHRMFLKAPKNIMQALACYLKGEKRILSPSVKAYITNQITRLDYSHELDRAKLQTRGKFYDILEIYNQLNCEYFNGTLDLNITWFGQGTRRKCNRITFGLFHDPLRLIKINRLLDHHEFPNYFVSYVIYHEMLHYVCPAYVDEKGYTHIHSKEFKEREKKFSHFNQAQKWIKDHQNELFNASY